MKIGTNSSFLTLTIVSVFLLTVLSQAVVYDCTNQPADTLCDDLNYCTLNDTCNGAGQCMPGYQRDCSHLTSSSTPCIFGVCEASRGGCILRVYSQGTPCDANNNLCDVERCDSLGRCINYNTPTYCPSGELCDSSTGRCVPELVTPSLSNTPTTTTTPSASSTATWTDTFTPAPTESPSDSPTPSQVSESVSLSMTPRPFWWLPTPETAESNPPAWSPLPVTSPSRSPYRDNEGVVPDSSTPHRSSSSVTSSASFLIVVSLSVAICCAFMAAGALMIFAHFRTARIVKYQFEITTQVASGSDMNTGLATDAEMGGDHPPPPPLNTGLRHEGDDDDRGDGEQ